jgi:tetratricopeptide (TPR) repeat protein
MPTEPRGRRPIVLATEPVVADGRHGVIRMTRRPPARRGVRVSLCVIARNEEAWLGPCLASAAPVVDEIIVADTGSTDGTVGIARTYGARVVHVEWRDDFAAARNAALAEATGTWVLALDADERLTGEAADGLQATVAETSAPALRLPVEEVDAQGDVHAIHFAVRLLRRAPGHRWQRTVCERPTVTATEYAALPIRHHGYASADARASRLLRNRALLERAIAGAPTDAELRQRLAWTLLLLDEPFPAAAHAEAALRRTRSTMTGLLAIDTLARARLAVGDVTGAANACRTALALRPDWADARLLLAEACQRMGRADEALVHYSRFLSDREQLLSDLSWPVRLPRLSSLTAVPAARVEIASVHASLHRADHQHDVLVGTA